MKGDVKVFLCFLAFRLVSILFVQTYYVPDEYWQSLEVAHWMTFGYGHLTWEWHQGIRNALYPLIFAFLYKAVDVLDLSYREVVILAPRVVQAVFTAIGDLYTVKLSLRLHGESAARWTLLCLLCSWFLFYCGSRTLINTMETSLTSVSLYYYPWKAKRHDDLTKFLSAATMTVIIRPTSAVLWVPLCGGYLIRERTRFWSQFCIHLLIGIVALAVMLVVDRLFFGFWICTLYNFVMFNVFSDGASIYGSHPWHWYWTQGFPVIMATQLIPFLMGAAKGKSPLYLLVWWQLLVYSFVPHKEFRFIMPVLPLSLCLVGKYLASISRSGESWSWNPRMVNMILLAINLPMMLYFGLVHQRGPLKAIKYIAQATDQNPATSVLFLMPCHSTPLYSHLHRNVRVHFLTCEPDFRDEVNYVDEADKFHLDPVNYMRAHYRNISTSDWPSYIVMYDIMKVSVEMVLQEKNFTLCHQVFHTHFPSGRIGSFINIYCR